MSRRRLWLWLLPVVGLTMPVVFLLFPDHRLSWNRVWTKLKNSTSLRGSPERFFVSYPHPYRLLLDQPEQCRRRRPFVVLMIPVAPRDRAPRDAIRQTWAKRSLVLGQVVSHYFYLGVQASDGGEEEARALQEQVIRESREHGDILQSDFVDSYHNLTIKTMLIMEWLSSRCPSASFAMKVDSDTFLSVRNLVQLLLEAPRRDYLTGRLARDPPVDREPDSKWFLPEEAFPDERYPPYVLGLGYAFSMDLPGKLVRASGHVRAVYIEDAYLGMCMRRLGIQPSEPPSSGLFRAGQPYFKWPCYWTSIVVTILESPQELLEAWREYQRMLEHGCWLSMWPQEPN